MSVDQQASIQQSSSNWTEPPWSGWIETTGDALLILEAARRGLIPRVTRRLIDSERKMITSGSVFVFDEDESGIKRWTDGFFWSPSRILGNFLLYRETDKRGGGHRGARGEPDTADSPTFSADPNKPDQQSLSRGKADNTGLGVDKQRERTLMGSLTNSYKFKPDGLMKKTFSVTIEGVAQHLVSYYKIEDVENGRLRSPSSLPELASLDISPEYLDKTHFRNPPKVEVGVDGVPRYRGEADDIDSSPSILSAPLSLGPPLLTAPEGLNHKRAKRYGPYGAGSASSPVPKRPRRDTKSSLPDSNNPTEADSPPVNASSITPQSVPQPLPASGPPAFQDTNMPINMATQPQPHPGPYPPYSVPAFYQYAPPPPPSTGHVYAAPPQVGVIAYAPGPHLSSSGGVGAIGAPPQGGGAAAHYATFPGYPHPTPSSAPQVHGSDPSQAQAGQPGPAPHQPPHAHPQPQYYSYYAPHPPPHAHPPPGMSVQYAPYHQWPLYSGYPPQAQPHLQVGQMQHQHPPPPGTPTMNQKSGDGSA